MIDRNSAYSPRSGFGRAVGAEFDEGLRRHMLRVYNYMGLGLAITGIVAMIVASQPAIYVPIFSTPLKWVVMLARSPSCSSSRSASSRCRPRRP
ncbi:hypothetical protein A6302_01227 [Methylobrevis pamukkalensis]|uniref:BAX inhibitor (BI)-1/YccA family protein n=1 Tax=Methylobrevis pamukkalensis TaxID=1439726 RepID=A0A1E3H561_9HYPH|nr:hypothetical protein A6302_01227 [Methylobrevis pamukkalensis]